LAFQLRAIKHALVANVRRGALPRRTALDFIAHRRPPTSRTHPPFGLSPARGPAPARSTIQISSALAKSERNTNCADWLPASSTCCSSGSQRINRARSFGRAGPGRARVAMLYDRGGWGRPEHAHRPVPVAPFQPSDSSLLRSPGCVERVARIVCLSERDGRDSDLSCVPNEKRPASAVDAVIWSALRPTESSLLLLLLAVVHSCSGWSSLSVR